MRTKKYLMDKKACVMLYIGEDAIVENWDSISSIRKFWEEIVELVR